MVPAPPEITFAIPCHNEAGNLAELVRQIEAQMAPTGRSFEIVIADDGSSDGSWAVLTELAATRPHLRALRFARNAGLSAALFAAIEAGRGRIVVTMDSDLQNDPADLPKFFAALDSADCVCGNRRAARRRGDTWLKSTISRLANAVRSSVLGDALSDSGCTYRVFRREAFAGLPFFNGVHRFIPVLMALRGCRVAEVPIANRERRYGRTHFGLGLLARRAAVIDMLGVRWLKSRMVRVEVKERLGTD